MKDLFDDTEDIGIRSLAISAKANKLVAGNSAGVVYIWTSEDGEEFVPQ